MEKERKKQLNLQFWKIENKEEALYIIKQCAYGFLFVGGLNVLLGYFVSLPAIIDGVIYFILALLLLFFKSRIVSILLLIASGLGVATTILNKIEAADGGSNMFLAMLVFYFAIASVYATFKYPKLN